MQKLTQSRVLDRNTAISQLAIDVICDNIGRKKSDRQTSTP